MEVLQISLTLNKDLQRCKKEVFFLSLSLFRSSGLHSVSAFSPLFSSFANFIVFYFLFKIEKKYFPPSLYSLRWIGISMIVETENQFKFFFLIQQESGVWIIHRFRHVLARFNLVFFSSFHFTCLSLFFFMLNINEVGEKKFCADFIMTIFLLSVMNSNCSLPNTLRQCSPEEKKNRKRKINGLA